MKDKYEAIKEIIALSREDLDDLPNRAEKELSANEVELASLRARLAAADKLAEGVRGIHVTPDIVLSEIILAKEALWEYDKLSDVYIEYRKAGG